MYAYNDYHPVWVITTNGVKEIRSLNPGDKLYQYRSRELMTVTEVIKPTPSKIFEIEYIDGRKTKVMLDDQIYLGENKTITPAAIIRDMNLDYPPSANFSDGLGNILYDAIDYAESSYPHQNPDPYTAGVMFTYADYDRREIVLPEWTSKTHDHIRNKYHLKYADILMSGRNYYFTSEGGDGRLLTWNELYREQRCFAKSSAFVDPIIPREYVWGTIKDRWNYVRGAMDAGFDPKIFVDGVGCASTDEVRMKELQKILWSIGVMSTLRYDPQSSKKRPWILEIVDKYKRYPGMFSHPDNIAWALHLDNTIIDQLRMMSLQIVSIKYLANGVVCNVKVDGWPKIYYDANFLPRISA